MNRRKEARRALTGILTAAMLLQNGASAVALAAEGTGEDVIVKQLVEGKESPFGVDTPRPSFSWQMSSGRVGARQESYQIHVTRADDESLVWDSGVVESRESVAVPYEGEDLEAATGVDFFPNLIGIIGETEAASVESTAAAF